MAGTEENAENNPEIENRQLFYSIVLPTHNRASALSECLRSLTRLEFPVEGFEVLVVDDGGSEPLDSIIGAVDRQLNIQLIKQENAGPAAARNEGAKRARGELLVFLDDDCRVDRFWLKELASSQAAAPGALLGGRIINGEVGNPYSTSSQQLICFLYEYFGSEESDTAFFTSSNLAVPARRFADLGGFNAEFKLPAGEDREFCDRWQHQGFEIQYVHEAVVYHYHDLNLLGFLGQHFRYGCGAYQFHRARKLRGQHRPRVEPLSFYSGILRYPFTQEGRPGQKLVHSLLMAVTQVANAMGYFWYSGRSLFRRN